MENGWDQEQRASSLLATFYRENPSLFPKNGYPTPIHEVANWCDANIINWNTKLESAVDTTTRPVSLYVQAGLSYYRQRFGIGHALGHLFLHPPGRYDYDIHDPIQEKEANDFSCRLLMPPQYFYAEAHTNGYDSLAHKFQVTPIAVTYRLRQLGML